MLGDIVAGFFGLEGADRAEDAAAQRNQSQIDFSRAQQAQNIQMQREFAQNGVRWRVEDAQAAGVHPLFALGGSGAAFAPASSSLSFDGSGSDGGLAQMGQHLGRAINSQETADQRALRTAIIKGHEASAQRDTAQAQYYASLAAREVTGPSFPSVVPNAYGGAQTFPVRQPGVGIEEHPLFKDAVKLDADPMTSRHVMQDGQTAGQDHPGMREFRFPGGFRTLLPATGGGGVPEEIDVSMIPHVVGANIEKYGWRWLVNYIGYATGQSPDSRRSRGSVESWMRDKAVPWYRDNLENRFTVPSWNDPKSRGK